MALKAYVSFVHGDADHLGDANHRSALRLSLRSYLFIASSDNRIDMGYIVFIEVL
jgi:hypothetical protein